jgi:hypothetical protein
LLASSLETEIGARDGLLLNGNVRRAISIKQTIAMPNMQRMIR